MMPGSIAANFSLGTSVNLYSVAVTTNATGAVTVTVPAGTFNSGVLACTATAVRDTTTAPTACFALVRSVTWANGGATVVIQVFESKTTGVVVGGMVEGLEPSTAATMVQVAVWGY